MEELREALKKAGLAEVRTYIQSGNLLIRHKADSGQVCALIQQCIKKDFGFDVPVLIYEPEAWEAIYSRNPYLPENRDQKGLYIVFLYDSPAEEKVSDLVKENFPHEQFTITPECIYLNCQQGYGKAKCNNNFFEQRLKVRATTRNLRTVQALAQMAVEMG